MSVYSTLRTNIRNVVLKALSFEHPTMPVIFTNQNGTEPAESYAAIYILSQTQIGHHQTGTLTSTTEQLSTSVVYEVVCQISFFGSKSGDASYGFNQAINNNPVVLEEVSRNKIGVMRKSVLRSNPQKRDTKWVDSFNMDVTFNCIVNSQQAVDVVENVILESVINDDYIQGQGWLISGNGSILGVDWAPSYDGTSFSFNGTTTYDADVTYTVTPPVTP